MLGYTMVLYGLYSCGMPKPLPLSVRQLRTIVCVKVVYKRCWPTRGISFRVLHSVRQQLDKSLRVIKKPTPKKKQISKDIGSDFRVFNILRSQTQLHKLYLLTKRNSNNTWHNRAIWQHQKKQNCAIFSSIYCVNQFSTNQKWLLMHQFVGIVPHSHVSIWLAWKRNSTRKTTYHDHGDAN